MIQVFDELRLFRGNPFVINDHLSIRHPTLGEICDYGEREYYSLVSLIVSTPSDLKVQLFDSGIDYESISEFDLFLSLYPMFSIEKTGILFGDFDFKKLSHAINLDTQEIILKDRENGFVFDKAIYEMMVTYLRKLHGLKKNTEVAGNEITKKIMIEEARRAMERNAKKSFSSFLLPMASALTNTSEFKFSYRDVWDVPIYVFMDSIKRIQKIKHYNFTMSGVYSGNVDIKKIPKKDLDWMGEV